MYGAARTAAKRNQKNRKRTGIKTTTGEIGSEHDLQKACVAKLRAHNMLCFCTDVFNGISFIKDIAGKAIYKQHMIAMGSVIGQSDLIILHDRQCTFVEFKWKKGKKSPDQEAFTKRVSEMGYETLEWRTLQECEDWIVKTLVESSNELQSTES